MKRIIIKQLLALCIILPFFFLISCPGENETPSVKYTVSFNTNGGGTIQPRTVDEGGTLTKPPNPVRIDHAFLGWFTDTALSNEYDFNTLVTGDFTLYAKWEQLMRVTFNSDGGTAFPFQNMKSGEPATEPNDIPVKRNYTFLGWFLGETKYDFSTPVTGNITLKAKWEALEIDASLGDMYELSGLTAMEYFTQKGLYLGWNAGNSLDAPGSETAWVSTALSQELFNGVKALGFNVVRIPVTWSSFIGAAPDYTINPTRLERVADVVEMAYNAGLVAIINVHHDTSWLSLRRARDSQTDRAQILDQYKKVWEQIATRLKGYGDWLIFECFNEIHTGSYGQGTLPQIEFDILNEWTQAFTDVVRETGGNNAERFLVIKPYYARPHHVLDNVTSLMVDRFKLPDDPAENKQIISVHYYDPEPFALNASSPSWGTTVERNAITSKFAPFGRVLVRGMGIPVIIGECGAPLQLYPSDPELQTQAHNSRVDYLEYLVNVARDNGIVPIYWDNGTQTSTGEKFGLIDRVTGAAWRNVEDVEIINAMVGATK